MIFKTIKLVTCLERSDEIVYIFETDGNNIIRIKSTDLENKLNVGQEYDLTINLKE